MKPGTRPPATTAHTNSNRSSSPRNNDIIAPAHCGSEGSLHRRGRNAKWRSNCTLPDGGPRTASRRRTLCWPTPPFGLKLPLSTADCPSIIPPAVDRQAASPPAQAMRSGVEPRWVTVLYRALLVYVVTVNVWMITGLGGPPVTHYVGLLSDLPASLASSVLALPAARHTRGALRAAWVCLAVALGLYFVGVTIGVSSWLQGQDPFPGTADIFYCAFYPALAAGALLLIRAAAVRVPWLQLTLDATIFVVGFGAFFWFLVIRPAAVHLEVDYIKQALSLAYLGLDCAMLLMLGVLLITGAGSVGGRRIPLLLLGGFAAMFLADILWSLAKVRGYYLPGGWQDVLYLVWYVPVAAAGREQLRSISTPEVVTSSRSDALAR